ncbi:hypothetical protein [Niabella ginsengisoli]|uniref:Lipoprotein n=1 Tax=Niabella ginsengisoli TaxID=522298 RepID=A0ABS9SKS6_9BACT|nr:hypothetical protein [Niabella ginsengisoli]MCH5598981.1 hypothetical protein [Niabella ginsengisoli]
MKRSIYLLAVIGTILFLTSCAKDVEDVNFVPEVKISFQEGGIAILLRLKRALISILQRLMYNHPDRSSTFLKFILLTLKPVTVIH